MNQLQLARIEWESNSTSHAKLHPLGRGVIHKHEFRKYGQAIAWLNWDGNCMEIAKFETLSPGHGAAAKLVEFLKSLADKYGVTLYGHATVYSPDDPIPQGQLLSQKELEDFYRRHGFKLRKISNEASEILYP
jgi:hypothetical protein